MATKILYNGNRIIIDGHADNAEECRAITAMCDSMANDENFKTIVYEKGHAVFERIGGGDDMMFSGLEAQVAALKRQVAAIKSCECDLTQHLSKNEAGLTYATISTLNALIERVTALESKPNHTLGYTAEQLSALLAKLENL